MIILLHGPDDYRRDQKKRELISEFEKKHASFGSLRFDLETDGDSERLRVFAQSQSMFDPVKLAVVEHPFAETGKEYINFLKSGGEEKNTILILSSADKPLKAFAFLMPKEKSKEFLAQEFAYLKEPAWSVFVKAEAKNRGVALTERSLKLLAQVFLGDTWGLVTELDKLALAGKEISEHELENLTLELAPDFWSMLGGLKNPSVGRRLATYEKLLSLNEPAAKIFNLIAYQWPEKLPRLAAYDIAVKSGKLDYEEALTDLLIG